MSEIDLTSSISAARDDVAKKAARYVTAQDELADASTELQAAQQKAKRLERALAILNGEEEPAPTSAATPPVVPSTTVPTPPPPLKPVPQGPYASVKCSACGEIGSMGEIYRPTKAGTMAHLLVCGDCNNEVYLG